MKEKEAEWLIEFYPGNEGRMGTKREPIKMPVSKKESAMVRNLKKTKKEKPKVVKENDSGDSKSDLMISLTRIASSSVLYLYISPYGILPLMKSLKVCLKAKGHLKLQKEWVSARRQY